MAREGLGGMAKIRAQPHKNKTTKRTKWRTTHTPIGCVRYVRVYIGAQCAVLCVCAKMCAYLVASLVEPLEPSDQAFLVHRYAGLGRAQVR
jgi:hypothetical protein